MQDKYVADIGDFGKYGLLRTLAGMEPSDEPCYCLGVVWYLRPDMKLNYLSKPEFHGYDETLFDHLRDMVDGQTRTVREVEKIEILGEVEQDVVFFSEPVPNRRTRGGWLLRALEKTEGARIVFLDPDNGLDLCEMEAKDQLSKKRVYLNEVRSFVERGQTVIIYQSYWRNCDRDEEVGKWRDERLADLNLA